MASRKRARCSTEALKANKPENVQGGDPWIQQLGKLTAQKSALESKRGSLSKQISQIASTPLNIRGVEVPPGKVGPVAAAVVDNTSGDVFWSLNRGEPPANATKDFADSMARMDPRRMHPSQPGFHAETHALNEASAARKTRTGRPVTRADRSSFTLATAWLDGDPGKIKGMAQGKLAERCANCAQLTEGVDNLAGDSVKPYAGPDSAKPPTSRWQARNLDAAKGGAKSGAAAGLLFGAIDTFRDGKLDADGLQHVAKSTALGAGTGAAGAVIEEVAGRGIDKLAGQAIERGASAVAKRALSAEVAGAAASGARALAGKLGGAGAAGAVINAGFSAVDQIGAYKRGEVTASQAIGKVTGEAAVGMGAGLAGAAAGAAIGSVIPVAGTVVGGVIGFAVGVGAGFVADKGLRSLGVDKAIGRGVTAAIDRGSALVKDAGSAIAGAVHSLAALGW